MSYFKEKYLNTIEYRCKYSKTKELIRRWLQPRKHGHCCWEAILSTEGRTAERDMLDWGTLNAKVKRTILVYRSQLGTLHVLNFGSPRACHSQLNGMLYNPKLGFIFLFHSLLSLFSFMDAWKELEALALSDRSLWMDRGSCIRASKLENMCTEVLCKHNESFLICVVMIPPPLLGLSPWIPCRHSIILRDDSQRWWILISVLFCGHFSSSKRLCGFFLVPLKNYFHYS